MNPKYSIGIPAFKEEYLSECIESVLSQAFTNFEIIIVNDASPQNVKGIVCQFDDRRIRYYENCYNFGAVDVINNWNKCLSLAKGEFFILLGDDDKMSPEYLSEFSELISSYPNLNVYHTRSFIIDEKSNIVQMTPSWPEKENVYDNIWHRMKGYRIQYISDFVFRTEWLKENNGFFKLPLAWGSDEVTSYLAMASKGIAHINKPLFMYRRHFQSITNSSYNFEKIIALHELELWFGDFLCNMPEDRDLYVCYSNVCNEYKKYIKRSKIFIISRVIHSMDISTFIKLLIERKKFGIDLGDFFYAALNSLKEICISNLYK